VKVDRNAPVFSEGQIEIAASPDAVWDLMADLSGWPTWNPDVKEVSVQGEVAEGTVFRWKAGPGTITSILRLVDRPRALGWTGRHHQDGAGESEGRGREPSTDVRAGHERRALPSRPVDGASLHSFHTPVEPHTLVR
jgi:uncharacterized protein YndB with AHSA1/START domain